MNDMQSSDKRRSYKTTATAPACDLAEIRLRCQDRLERVTADIASLRKLQDWACLVS